MAIFLPMVIFLRKLPGLYIGIEVATSSIILPFAYTSSVKTIDSAYQFS